MPLDPAASSALVKDLKKQLAMVEADLRARSEQPDLEWAADLRSAYDSAFERGRTAQSWSTWRDDEIAQAAVAWVLATVFLRFCEDNDLLGAQWIAGPGDRLALAVDAEMAFYAADPTRDARAWLREGFGALASTKPGSGILDRSHNAVWSAPLGVGTCQKLIAFWREQDAAGALLRDLSSDTLDTRFLGDLYQDLSESAKKKYALLQTPVFVEQFILDRTLTPALAEFGLDGLRLIDPTCGSGHFLLGAFDRLLAEWRATAPGLDERELVQRALDHIHGVDLNPFAVAIARFRLAVAALLRLRSAAAHRGPGVPLPPGSRGLPARGDRPPGQAPRRGWGAGRSPLSCRGRPRASRHPRPGRYHVVVGNPPYITVKDKALNEAYRAAYKTLPPAVRAERSVHGAVLPVGVRGTPDTPAGFVGQITSNSFMKREFGSKVIESLLSGDGGPDPRQPNPVDLLDVVDTSGAYIPGHGTPTVILVGRRQRPSGATVRAVLGVRGEPGEPDDPAKGLVWTEIVEHIDDSGFDGTYVTVTELDRTVLRSHPWSLSGGEAGGVKEVLESAPFALRHRIEERRSDNAQPARTKPSSCSGSAPRTVRARWTDCVPQVVLGEEVRDYSLGPT